MAPTAGSHEDVKVVLIDTRYVQTDPLSFKSVVQKLTGKDCCVAWIEESSFSGLKPETKVAAERPWGTATPGVGSGGASVLTKGYSFKDLDRMILEAPPVDELKWFWTD
ncbi:putative Glucan endo-1,3-beta-glucosidase precursor [Hibiscus syriacus]|uniref:Glucan endo-1,3-beta-glucosidase n=1 Tax=Hibiscus syriacus TaxID=106335 RepID=A0A6A2WWG3_HIBSY|nr:VQ motif-containing protein 1-like [Hibiscus syriacus]KAE8659625.1 putative Glucan endo-1,3-beta-glucosidase precursor [Hibiscus syriacus]